MNLTDLTGEWGDNEYVITRGDTRISLIIPRDEYTVKLQREQRFIIDDYDNPEPLAYRLSKPFKLGGNYNGKGIFTFVLQEVPTEDNDNLELHIANYYDHFPRENEDISEGAANTPDTVDSNGGEEVWI